MIGVMSLWTGTMQFRLQREHCLLHTLAACYAQQNFEHTELVTDTVGLEIADRLGWQYTTFVNALDDVYGETPATNHIWALGKLMAISLQEEPFCHIDNDVILQKPLPDRIREAAIFAQSKDVPGYYWNDKMASYIEAAGFPKYCVPFNTGIIGGVDADGLRAYAKSAMAYSESLCPYAEQDGTGTSMIIEQYYLGAFARQERIRIEELIPIHWTQEECAEVGYTHLIGHNKRNPSLIRAAEKRLADNFPNAYARFIKGWNLLDNG